MCTGKKLLIWQKIHVQLYEVNPKFTAMYTNAHSSQRQTSIDTFLLHTV